MTFYEANKNLYTNITPMKKQDVKKVIDDFLQEHESCYYLMLNHEIKYYTLFHTHDFNSMTMNCEMYSIIKGLGPVLDIEYNKNTQMLEVWIRYEGEPIMFGIFDYTRGVVEV